MFVRMARQQLLVGRRASLARIGKLLEQDGKPLRPLRMSAEHRVQARERRVCQDVDWTIFASSSSDRPPVPLLWARPRR